VERKQQLFEVFEMKDFAEVKVENLSTGMKQKTALAISLLHQPQVIIFDEPTNGLDVITSRMVIEYLLKLKEKGHTIIISSHIFSMVEKICDRVGIIINGRMQSCGTLADICDEMSLEDRFFEIYYADKKNGNDNE
jgi:sodium transport system ATP-binding protein